MKTLRSRALAMLFLMPALLVASNARAQDEDDPAVRFARAVRLAGEGRLEQAVAEMERVRSAYPDDRDVLWNLGLWYADSERSADALEVWRHYRDVQPDDWRVRAKLIQAYQALGRTALRDEERAALLEWYADPENAGRPERALYCREQFRVSERRVMAFETFLPPVEARVLLRFSVLDESGREESWFVLGSDETANEVARATGAIGEHERMFRLDRYEGGSRATLGVFKKRPTYEAVRQHVVAAMKGELRPLDATPPDD